MYQQFTCLGVCSNSLSTPDEIDIEDAEDWEVSELESLESASSLRSLGIDPFDIFWIPHRTQSWAAFVNPQKVTQTWYTIPRLTDLKHFLLHLQSDLFKHCLIRILDFPFVAAIDSPCISSPGNIDKCVSKRSLRPLPISQPFSSCDLEDEWSESEVDPSEDLLLRFLQRGLLWEEDDEGEGALNRFML